MNRISKFNKVIELKYLPKSYEFGTIYHCKQSKSIRYLCPDNDCRKLVILPLSTGSYDSWCIQGRRKMFRQRESITLHPSVWSTQHDNKCHYWIKSNKIKWVDDEIG